MADLSKQYHRLEQYHGKDPSEQDLKRIIDIYEYFEQTDFINRPRDSFEVIRSLENWEETKIDTSKSFKVGDLDDQNIGFPGLGRYIAALAEINLFDKVSSKRYQINEKTDLDYKALNTSAKLYFYNYVLDKLETEELSDIESFYDFAKTDEYSNLGEKTASINKSFSDELESFYKFLESVKMLEENGKVLGPEAELEIIKDALEDSLDKKR